MKRSPTTTDEIGRNARNDINSANNVRKFISIEIVGSLTKLHMYVDLQCMQKILYSFVCNNYSFLIIYIILFENNVFRLDMSTRQAKTLLVVTKIKNENMMLRFYICNR